MSQSISQSDSHPVSIKPVIRRSFRSANPDLPLCRYIVSIIRHSYNKKKYPDTNEVPRPEYWSGWRLIPNEIEFWLDGENRIHERLKYKFVQNKWDKFLLSP